MKYLASTLFAGCFLLLGCGTKPSNVSPSAPPSVLTSPIAAPVVFKPKPLPVLGTTAQQLEDRAIIAQAVMGQKEGSIPIASKAGVKPNPFAISAGITPKGVDVCNLPYSALNKPMYETCFKEGMPYEAVANIIGYAGSEKSRSGNSFNQVWSNGKGAMSATFIDNKMVSVAQSGLE